MILEKAPEGEHGGNMRVAGQGSFNTSPAGNAAAYCGAGELGSIYGYLY